ncbi:hypothetical protein [Acidovorax sp. MR-S7]|uniref:hypothetical protein n=1 Tax=Acidovorax sp. MR-S7 TaxID=1268622 RepID=UPI0003646FD3|nr:hypothetical protein [Acidovorax sp. MR-S7]GAD21377.1 transcriptional regulator [Acidovorax sp. MR-S7]
MSFIASLTSAAGLRRVLWADAAAGGAMAALHLAAAEPLAGLLGLSPALLSASGWLALPFVLLAGSLALRPVPAGGALALLAAGNFLWVLASAAVLWDTAGWGQAYVAVQAAAVLVLAELQWMGLRRGRTAARAVQPA